MGGAMSKRRIFKRSKKKKTTTEENNVDLDEPVYQEIGPADDASSISGSSRTSPSTDSAFSERNSSLDSSSTLRNYDYRAPAPYPYALPRISDNNMRPDSQSLGSYYVYNPMRTHVQDHAASGGADDVEAAAYNAHFQRRTRLDACDLDATDDADVYNAYAANDDNDYDEYEDSDDYTYISNFSFCGSLVDVSNYDMFMDERDTHIPLEWVPHMVEAFQPLLERTLDVLELIPHLSSIIDPCEFDQEKDVKQLIDRIKTSDEPGKWRLFVDALKMAGYEYPASLLLGETEDDHCVNRKLLELFTPHIMYRIDPEEFIDHLFEQRVINERDMEEVKCEKDRRGPIAASFMLLYKVPRRIPEWFDVFLDVLAKCGMDDVVEKFRIPEVSVCTETNQTSSCSNTCVKKVASGRPKKNRKREKKQSRWIDLTEKKQSLGNNRSSTDNEYLTPIFDSPGQRGPPFYPPPPLPSRDALHGVQTQDASLKRAKTKNKILKRRHSKTFSKQRHCQEVLRQQNVETIPKHIGFDKDPNETLLRQRHTEDKLTSHTDKETFSQRDTLKKLRMEKDILERQLEEQREIAKLKTQIKAYQQKLKEMCSDSEKENIKDEDEKRTISANKDDSPFIKTEQDTENIMEQTNEENRRMYVNEVNSGGDTDVNGNQLANDDLNQTDNVPEAQPESNEENQILKVMEEIIAELLSNVKLELKKDIMESREHILETLIKNGLQINRNDPAAEDNYVTVELGFLTELPTEMKLYSPKRYPSVLCPSYHRPGMQYSVDSAMFSDYFAMTSENIYIEPHDKTLVAASTSKD